MVFKRKIYEQMLNWKRDSNGQTALLVEGARRVGKSTIVEEFARNEYKSYILVDFNRVTQTTKDLFTNLTDLNYIFMSLQTIYNKSLKERESVIIFDEIQNCPLARQAIKYLVADGRYDYIETGSLLSIKKNVEGITLPSEEERIEMHPMDYEEFRWAVGDTTTVNIIRESFEIKRMMGEASTRKLLRDLRLYMLVGGMPQAVNEYLRTNDLRAVDAMKRRILKLYEDDLMKLDSTGGLSRMLITIPSQLSKNVNRYRYPKTEKPIGNEHLKMLADSKIVNVSYHVNDPNIGLNLTRDDNYFKMYMADTGLFITLAFWEKSFIENEIYQKLLSDKLKANLGYVYENLVAQLLVASGNALYYHTWNRDEKHLYEIDFLISRKSKLCPIEVKSSGYKTHASLDAFCNKYSQRVGESYLLYTKDLRKDKNTWLLPVFMTPFL